MSTPVLDRPLRRISDFANFSKPWFLVAAALALFGGAAGRRAAITGATAIALTSFVINQPMKLAGDRRCPDRTQLGVPESRWVSMPTRRRRRCQWWAWDTDAVARSGCTSEVATGVPTRRS
jgi:undecaprenyl-diphosphatase